MVEPVDSVVPHRSKRIRTIDNQDSKTHESISNEASKLFMSIVNDDILFEILVRLNHAKYAIQSSLVSKRWLSLVHHPHFAAEFSRQTRRWNGTDFELLFRIGGCVLPDGESLSCQIPITENNNTIYPISSFHGLKCPSVIFRASSQDLILLDYYDTKERYLYNFNTNKRLKIPQPTAQGQQLAIGIIASEPPGGYKVVTVHQGHLSHFPLEIFFFCSQTQAWSRWEFSNPRPAPLFQYRFRDGVSVGPVLYFPIQRDLVFAGVCICQPTAAATISWRFADVPRGFRGGWMACPRRLVFGAVSGRLRVSQMSRRKGVFSLKIWELNYEYESESPISWVLVHDVKLRSGNNDKTRMFVVAFHPYNGDAVFMLRDCKNICMYSNLSEGDKYEVVGRLPISVDKLSDFRKDDMFSSIKVFPVLQTPWPTPL